MPVVKRSARESGVEAELVRRVTRAGGICDKVRLAGQRGEVDRLVILPNGVVRFVELKRPKGGRLSAHQIRRHDTLRALGAVVVVIRNSADIDRLMTAA